MRIKHILLITLLFVSLLKTHAQPGYSLTDCIQYSLTHHMSARINSNKVKIAKEQLKQSISAYLPQINNSVEFINNLKLATTVIPAGIVSKTPLNVQFGQKYNANLSLDVSQPIYNQEKIDAIRANKPNLEIVALQDKQNQETLIYNTAMAYFQVLICKELENKLNSVQDTYQKLLKIVNLQVNKGVAIQTDADRLQVSLNATEYQLNETKAQQTVANNTLKNAMGFSLDSTIEIKDTLHFDSYLSLPFHQLMITDSIFDYHINKANVELQKLNYQSKIAAFMPTISAVAHWGDQAYNNIAMDIFDTWHRNSYVGISLSVPLNDFLKKSSQIHESKLNYENAQLTLKLNEQSYQLRFENAQKDLLTAYDTYFNNKNNLTLAKRILDNTCLNYQKGTATLSDFLNDDNAYTNAQTNYISSLYSYMTARLDYEKAKGTLFSFYHHLSN